MQLNPLVGLLDMFPGLHVGQVLGQGRFGSVYQGRWQSVNVAIKASGGRLTTHSRIHARLMTHSRSHARLMTHTAVVMQGS